MCACWLFIFRIFFAWFWFYVRDFNIILPMLLERKGEKLPYPDADDYPAER